MRDIASGTVPLTDALLNDFAAGANKVFFRSSLMPRIKIRLTEEGVLHEQGMLGHTRYLGRCLEQQQVHRAEIELDPLREPSDLSDAQLRDSLPEMLLPCFCTSRVTPTSACSSNVGLSSLKIFSKL